MIVLLKNLHQGHHISSHLSDAGSNGRKTAMAGRIGRQENILRKKFMDLCRVKVKLIEIRSYTD